MKNEEEMMSGNDSGMEDESIWEELEPLSSGSSSLRPAGRCGHVALSSQGGKALVVIGGYNEDGILDDVWTLDLDARVWSRVKLRGLAPPARVFFRGCAGPPPGGDVEEGGDFAFVFGGADAEGVPSSDMWCLDVEGRTWSHVHPAGPVEDPTMPCPRTNHAMCRMGDVLVVHAGESASGAQLDDMWLFDPRAASWAPARTSPTGPRPRSRSSHCLAFAESWPRSAERSGGTGSAGVLVVFGGLEEESDADRGPGDDAPDAMPLNDLWVLGPLDARSLQGGPAAIHGHMDDGGLPVWSLVVVDGVGPSPRSLADLAPRACRRRGSGDDEDDSVAETAELLLFGGFGLVELPATEGMDGDEGAEGGLDIITAYLDDLWGLSLQVGGGGSKPGNNSETGGDKGSETGATGAIRAEWLDEEGMGYPGPSPVEGRNGHTLTWCGEQLVLFGGFVGDGFDSGVHVAELPSPESL